MTSRQPRRERPRDLPAESLPRLHPAEERERRRILRASGRSTGERRPAIEHHVVSDYRYVRKDLMAIVVVTAVSMAFIVTMSFVL